MTEFYEQTEYRAHRDVLHALADAEAAQNERAQRRELALMEFVWAVTR